MNYSHLTISDRFMIEVLLKDGLNYSYIAGVLGVHRSTIQREVSRNHHFGTYDHQMAHIRSQKRKFRGQNGRTKSLDWSASKRCLPRFWRHRGRYQDMRHFRIRLFQYWQSYGKCNRYYRRKQFIRLFRKKASSLSYLKSCFLTDTPTTRRAPYRKKDRFRLLVRLLPSYANEHPEIARTPPLKTSRSFSRSLSHPRPAQSRAIAPLCPIHSNGLKKPYSSSPPPLV